MKASVEGAPQALMMWISRYCIFAYLLLIPWSVVWLPFGSHSYARVAEVLLNAICAMHIAQTLFGPRSSLPELHLTRWWRIWLIMVGMLAISSVLCAPLPAKALQELAVWLGGVCVALTIAWSTDEHDIRRIGHVIVGSTLFYNVLALLIPFFGMLFGGFVLNVEELPVGYENRRFFNHVQTVALPLTAAALLNFGNSKSWRLAAWAALTSGFGLLFLTGGRGTFVGLATGVLMSPLWLRRSTWAGVRPLVLSALGGFIAYRILFVSVPDALNLSGGAELTQRAVESGSVRARFLLWHLAINYIEESPWLGVGPMHFAHRPNWEAAHPHNIYLQLGAEWGLPMLALLVIGISIVIYRLIRTVRQAISLQNKLIGGALTMACVAILVDGSVSGNFVMPTSQVWIAAFAGIVALWLRLNAYMAPAATGLTNSGPYTARLVGFALFLIQAIQLGLIADDLAACDNIQICSEKLMVNEHLSPRFWVDGWF